MSAGLNRSDRFIWTRGRVRILRRLFYSMYI